MPLILALALLASASAGVKTENVQARLLSELDAAAPGSTFQVALELNVNPGWHTYWVNPGDAGMATSIEWTLPKGWSAGEIEWPAPKRFETGGIASYGYEAGTTWLLTTIKVPKNAKGPAALVAKASWLECSEICIPGNGSFELEVRVEAKPVPGSDIVRENFAEARKRIPVPAPWKATILVRDKHVTLDLAGANATLANAGGVTFFPEKAGVVDPSGQTLIDPRDGRMRLSILKAANAKLEKKESMYVIVSTTAHAWRVRANVSTKEESP